MAYSEAAKKLRQCKWIKADGSQCRGYSKLGGRYCGLHSYDHRKKKLPKKGAERAAAAKRRAHKRAQTSRHQTCECLAYEFKHRDGSGLCRFPDEPTEVYRVGEVERPASDEQRERQAERTIERDDRARGEVAPVCNCSKFPWSHRLHERVEQQSGDDASDLQQEIE